MRRTAGAVSPHERIRQVDQLGASARNESTPVEPDLLCNGRFRRSGTDHTREGPVVRLAHEVREFREVAAADHECWECVPALAAQEMVGQFGGRSGANCLTLARSGEWRDGGDRELIATLVVLLVERQWAAGDVPSHLAE